MGNAIKTYKRIYIYIIIDVHGFTQRPRPISYSGQPMTNRDFPVSHWAVSVTYREHKIDVKENEKSGEMRGFATPKQGMRGKK